LDREAAEVLVLIETDWAKAEPKLKKALERFKLENPND